MITVLEPHADDAFLSMGGHLARLAPGEARIVGVYSSLKRSKEGAAYADTVGAGYWWLGYEEAGSMDTVSTPSEDLVLPSLEPNETVYVPLGLRHKEHYAVRDAADRTYSPHQIVYYVDQPYALQTGNSPELDEKLSGMQIESVMKPHGNKYRKSVVDIFKTQSRFFYYNKDTLKYITEMLVRRP